MDEEFVVCELVLVELYMQLRNGAIFVRPFTAREAAAYCQGKISANFGRDHHPRCFSMWMAGGGIKAGTVYGETDEFGYNVVKDGLHIHDFHATLLHLLGIDHERLTYKFQGRRYRLTDVEGQLVKGILA